MEALKEAQGDDMQEVFFIDRWINQGRQEGRQEGLQREVNLVLRLLKRKFGIFDASVETKILALPIGRLERLGEDLLDFQTVADLHSWLNVEK